MCGVNAIYDPEFRLNPHTACGLIAKMNESIRHRGPDGDGVFTNKCGVYLGHRRLSILDLSNAGAQPMSLESGTTIVFNGEIYNFEALRALVPNHKFRSRSDTEVVLALYDKFKLDCFKLIEGMFGVVIWDSKQQQIVVARDRMGEKPLYLHIDDGIFSISSEMRSFRELPWFGGDISDEGLYDFLTFGFVPAPKSIFSNVQKIMPGECVIINDEAVLERFNFWEAGKKVSVIDEKAAVTQLADVTRSSVENCMVSDVPVGLFLSGGVDSSAVAEIMRSHTTKEISSFSVGFQSMKEFDESEQASNTAAKLGFKHTNLMIEAADLRGLIENITEIFDEPLSDPTSLPILLLTSLAKSNGIKVVLTGDGPDEQFLSYGNWHRYLKLRPLFDAYSKLPFPFKSYTHKLIASSGNEFLKEFSNRALQNQTFFWGKAASFKESAKRQLMTREYADSINKYTSYRHIETHLELFKQLNSGIDYDYGDWMTFLGVRHVIPNYYALRADRLGMANSVELRSPFLHPIFVDTSLSLSTKLKTLRGESKYIFKSSLKHVVSNDVLNRKKKGFCLPLAEWGGDLMLEKMYGSADKFCISQPYFRKEKVYRIIDDYHKERKGNINDIWNLFFLISWFDRWVFNGR